MKITTLQGINLKNPISTVILEYKNPKEDLIEFVQKLHPIFMENYVVKKGNVEITTKFPSLWKNKDIGHILQSYSNGKLSFKTAKSKMLDAITLMVHSMSTIPIIEGAQKLGYEVFPFYYNNTFIKHQKGLNRTIQIGIGQEMVLTESVASTGDSRMGFGIQRDKWKTNTVLDILELDIASWAKIDSEKDLPKVAKEIQFPMVIKPAGLTGGACVKVGIKNMDELKHAYQQVIRELKQREEDKGRSYRDYQKQIIAQKMVSGKDFRILVVDGKVEIVTNRIPARVIGDGSHSVSELIKIENKDPRRDITLPTHTLKPIKIDSEVKKILKEQDLSLKDVPQKGQIVQVRKVASMSQGGITEDYTDKTHPQVKLICESIAKTIHTYALGIDVLANDISKPLTPENGCIIEVNTRPESYLNAFPVIGKQYPDIGEKIVRGLIPENLHTNRVIFIGGFPLKKMIEITRKNISETNKIGIYEKGAIYINDMLINDDVDIEEGLLALKKNRTLDTIVVHYENENGIVKHGTGFDQINLMIYDDSVSDTIVQKIKSYKSQNLISKITKIS